MTTGTVRGGPDTAWPARLVNGGGRADARHMAGTIAALEREGVMSSTAMAKALNERGMATARGGRWAAITVINLRRRLKRLGL